MTKINFETIESLLKKCWSKESSTLYTPQNPAKGQCGVTSLVIQDIFGGEIVKTETIEGWHYYNRFEDKYIDFTESQFERRVIYVNHLSNREEAMQDTNQEQYSYLKKRFTEELNKEG